MIGLAAIAVTGAATYGLLIFPQATSTATARAGLETLQASNAATEGQIPGLKAQLANISGSVESLKALSSQVPPAIDLPALYLELNAVAAQAGEGVAVTNVSVSLPALVSAAAPAAVAVDAPAADPVVVDPAAVSPVAAAVLASYSVSMDVSATPTQAASFLEALGATSRLSVVTSSTINAGLDGAQGTAHVSATFYLQQVDVNGLAEQIEALAAAAPQ